MTSFFSFSKERKEAGREGGKREGRNKERKKKEGWKEGRKGKSYFGSLYFKC